MLNILIGVISGVVSAMGMGGGTILILCLSLFLGKDQHVAQGANLIFFIPTALVSIFMNIKQKLIKWKTGLVVGFFGIVGAVIGAKISVNLDTNRLKLYFRYIFIIYCSYSNIFSFKKRKSKIKV